MIDQVKLIRDRMKVVQDRQKCYIDLKRFLEEFNVGDHGLPRVSPMRGVVCFGDCGK